MRTSARFWTLMFAFVSASGLAPTATKTAEAQSVSRIRYFVAPNSARPTDLFEVIDGAVGGGRLVRDGRSEFIPGPSAGVSIGFTDRASRRDPIVTEVIGSGVVTLQVRSGSRVLVSIPSVPLPTPGNRNVVTSNPLLDNISVAVLSGTRIIGQRRLPLGTRP